MDELDNKIIKILQNNSREPFLNMAKTLKVSEGTIRKRVKKLMSQGVITGFSLKLKREVGAVVGVKTNPNVKTSDIVNQFQKLKISTLYEVTGRYDVICIIDANTMDEMNDLLEAIRATDGVIHTETFTILKQR